LTAAEENEESAVAPETTPSALGPRPSAQPATSTEPPSTQASATNRENQPPAPPARGPRPAAPVPTTAEPDLPQELIETIDVPGATTSALSWDQLREAVKTCQACGLHHARTQTVFGVGNPEADLMIIGEAPGAEEDRQGEPFVGRAGRLLDAMLEAIGLDRQAVFIANIVKCRPPNNRDPHAEEAAACRPFLHRQIALIQPRLILSVGRVSAHNLLGSEEAVGRLRGRVHRFDPGDIPLIVTYHPAYLLRRPQEKAKAWQDLQAAYRLLNTSMD
jgi:DNA polymerase